MLVNDNLDAESWKDVYKKIVHWDIELEKSNEPSLVEILSHQKAEANSNFFKFIFNLSELARNIKNLEFLLFKIG